MSSQRSLADILLHQMQAGRPVPAPVTLAICLQVCDALAHAHDLHRNLSPASIIISEAGVQVVSSPTPHGALAYVAPEYLTTGAFDARGDVFALGVVAYEMLTNRPLFHGASEQDTLDRVCSLVIPPPSASNPDVVPDIDGIVLMALARDPAHRWQHVTMMRDGLAAIAQRFGLLISTEQSSLWANLLGGRLGGPTKPAPRQPEVWVDDEDGATRIEAFNPAMLEALAAAHASAVPAVVPPVEPTPPRVQPAPKAPLGRAIAIPPLAPPRDVPAVRPAAATLPGGDIHAALAAIDMRLEPPSMADAIAKIDMQLEPDVPPPAPPEVRAPVRPMFDPELGPEPTQIGAMPLISFGNTRPLAALVGEASPRAPARESPEPLATFLHDAPVPFYKNKRVIAAGAIAAVILILILIVLVAR